MSEPAKSSREAVNKIFGDVMPEIGPNERDRDSYEDAVDRDRWLRDNIPPHHDQRSIGSIDL
ncbi:hypothetical protein [uncultured Mycolicibacterium sp.]|uniref:hypothetical protein n=1 Tax=uncultured Mycolicibacterium sp. TaxID=2320817 RepID=UPI0026275DD9|nr:hypothetical protein [uncultured Mycolicibacterium sp.]